MSWGPISMLSVLANSCSQVFNSQSCNFWPTLYVSLHWHFFSFGSATAECVCVQYGIILCRKIIIYGQIILIKIIKLTNNYYKTGSYDATKLELLIIHMLLCSNIPTINIDIKTVSVTKQRHSNFQETTLSRIAYRHAKLHKQTKEMFYHYSLCIVRK